MGHRAAGRPYIVNDHYDARVEAPAGGSLMYYVQHGAGRPVVVLHGAGVDHREPEACFEPIFAARTGSRRFYPDLPGMGRTAAPANCPAPKAFST